MHLDHQIETLRVQMVLGQSVSSDAVHGAPLILVAVRVMDSVGRHAGKTQRRHMLHFPRNYQFQHLKFVGKQEMQVPTSQRPNVQSGSSADV